MAKLPGHETLMLMPPTFQEGFLLGPIEIIEEGFKDGNAIFQIHQPITPVHKNADGEWERGLYASDERMNA